ncbi:MAG: cyclic nucleotide-binding protein [Chitinophagales bacterium]|nr:MAG: cyclic nucleotide-binding protein [Chitinophagales bacterium]
MADSKVALKAFFNQIVKLTDEEAEDISRYFKPLTLKEGRFLVEKGEVCNRIAFIRKGFMRAFYEINDEVEVTKYIQPKHTLITAFTSFISRQPSEEYIQALTDCDLWVIDYKSMQHLYAKYPKWQELGRIIMEQIYQYMEKRILSFLTLNAEQRYKSLLEENPRLIQDVPLRYIASMLGITPETLSRIRQKVHQPA